MRLGFEATYCMNVVRRFLTLPLRRQLPCFYIIGFPKCGTTSLANHLKMHPAFSCIDGLPWHDVLSKESHYLNGVMGARSACSKTIYRSFFPTILSRWWAECVKGVSEWMCFDACPLPACLPYTARRIHKLTPNAKLIFMVRDPVNGCFSAEIMLRNIGVDLKWSFMEDLVPSDPRFAETAEDTAFWKMLSKIGPDDPLPPQMMKQFYERCSTVLRCGRYAERVKPFLDLFPKENIMFVDFKEFITNTESVVKQVVEFIGADPGMYKYKELPAGMAGERKGRRMHPAVRCKLVEYFREYNLRLYAMLGRDFGWTESDIEEGVDADNNNNGKAPATSKEKELVAVVRKSSRVAAMGQPVVRKNSSVLSGVSQPVRRVVSITARASQEPPKIRAMEEDM